MKREKRSISSILLYRDVADLSSIPTGSRVANGCCSLHAFVSIRMLDDGEWHLVTMTKAFVQRRQGRHSAFYHTMCSWKTHGLGPGERQG